MDRFLLRINLGYPQEEEERAILQRFRLRNPLEELQPVIAAEELLHLQAVVREVFVHPAMEQYIVRLVRDPRACRTSAWRQPPQHTCPLPYGPSPRQRCGAAATCCRMMSRRCYILCWRTTSSWRPTPASAARVRPTFWLKSQPRRRCRSRRSWSVGEQPQQLSGQLSGQEGKRA